MQPPLCENEILSSLPAPEAAATLAVTWRGQSRPELLIQIGEWLEPTDPSLAQRYYEAARGLQAANSLAAYRAGKLALKLG